MATKEKKTPAPKASKAPKAAKTAKAPSPKTPKSTAKAAPKKAAGLSMDKVRELAKEKGAKIGGLSKTEAIRAIQIAEGYDDCFGRDTNGQCPQDICLFREDCVALSKPVGI